MKLMANSLIRRRGHPDVPPGTVFEVSEPEAAAKMLEIGYAVRVAEETPAPLKPPAKKPAAKKAGAAS